MHSTAKAATARRTSGRTRLADAVGVTGSVMSVGALMGAILRHPASEAPRIAYEFRVSGR